MDCLDRTNVVQSVLARKALLSQLRMTSVLNSAQTTEEFPDFESHFKNGEFEREKLSLLCFI